MYRPSLTAKDLESAEALGLTREEVLEQRRQEQSAEVWPENEQAALLFRSLGTQWLVGPGGAYGLNYAVLFHKMDRLRLTPERYEELEFEIRVIESAALAAMHEGK